MSTSSLSSSTDTVSLGSYKGSSATRLHSTLDCTCSRFMSSLKFSIFKSKYRRIYKNNPELLRNIYQQLCTQLAKSISDDLQMLCTEHRIDFLLNNLELMKQKQDSSQNSWRPSGDCEEDMRDHYYQLKLKQKESLEELLSKLKVKNEELSNMAAVNHAEIMHIKVKNESLYDSFSKIVNSFRASSNLIVSNVLDTDEI